MLEVRPLHIDKEAVTGWTGELALARKPDGDPRDWRTTQDLGFASVESGFKVLVKAGSRTDLTSVPRLLWWYASPMSGKHAAAAVIHDALYRSKTLNREISDQIFLEAMLDLGVRSTKAYAMYWSVRLRGRRAWERSPGRWGRVRGIPSDPRSPP